MSKSLRIFLVVFVLSLPFWWGINVLEKKLEDFFYWREIETNPEILKARLNLKILEKKTEELKPFFNPQAGELQIEAKSAISVLTRAGFVDKVLFENNIEKKLPIASLTKLFTAQIVLENYDLSRAIEISEEAVGNFGDFGKLKIGETFKTEDLLYPLLIESSNDAALALAEIRGEKEFVELMNSKVKELGMEDTYFANSSGLDPDTPEGEINYSTARDLVKFIGYLLKNQSKVWQVSATPEFKLYSPDGVFHHKLKNTNELLFSEELGQRIIGGKTGWTPMAGGCLVLVLRAPKNQGFLINVILGSEDRFEEMRKLTDWIYRAYQW